MIFYNGEMVDYKKKDTELAKEISKTIAEFKLNNFGKDKKGFCQLRYPNGVRVKNISGKYEPKKQFFLDLVSWDGLWRWSDAKPRNGKFRYQNGNHLKISDPYMFEEKDAELVWFLQTHCPQVKSGKVYFEDFEAKAEKEAKELVEDLDIRHAIYSKKSPVSQDIPLLRQVAEVFGIEDVNKLGVFELRNALYHKITNGEASGSKYVNFQRFEELTDNKGKMRAATTIRKAINEESLRYNKKDKSWWSCAAGEDIECLLTLKPNEVADKEGVLLEKVIEDKSFRAIVYAELGITGYATKDEVKDLGYTALAKICKLEGIEVKTTDKLADLVDKYCEKFNIGS